MKIAIADLNLPLENSISVSVNVLPSGIIAVNQSSITRSAYQDRYVIHEKMTDDQVWARCQIFGASRLIEALENFLNSLSR